MWELKKKNKEAASTLDKYQFGYIYQLDIFLVYEEFMVRTGMNVIIFSKGKLKN